MSVGFQLTLLDETKSPIQILRERHLPPNSPIVVAFGGGVNSTAAILLLKKLSIRPDLILFADTGGEKRQTYEYIEYFSDWLVQNDFPPVTVVRREMQGVSKDRKYWKIAQKNWIFYLSTCLKKSRFDSTLFIYLIFLAWFSIQPYSTLEQQCLVTQSLPSVAYGHKTCSIKWKREPQDEFVKSWALDNGYFDMSPKGKLIVHTKIRKIIGFHAGEVHRLLDKNSKQMKPLEDKFYYYEYPLMSHLIDNESCKLIIKSEGLDVPPKSACFLCPNTKIEEIRKLDPEYKARALFIEQLGKNGLYEGESSIKGLGRRFSWADLLNNEISELEEAAFDWHQERRSCGCMDE